MLNIAWWLAHMIRIVKKLITNEVYEGHWLRRARKREESVPPSGGCGTLSSSTSSVIAIAKTPSLKASVRPVSFSCFSSAAGFTAALFRRGRRGGLVRGEIGDVRPLAVDFLRDVDEPAFEDDLGSARLRLERENVISVSGRHVPRVLVCRVDQ